MLKGIVYFLVIILANTIGSVSGMGGGVIIKPVLDFFALDSVAAVSFYSTVAVFVMSIVSTIRQVQNGIALEYLKIVWLSIGSVLGGILGNTSFEMLLTQFNSDTVQFVQIFLTIVTLVFAFLYTRFEWRNFNLQSYVWYLFTGIVLGFIASLLGIGGGPINVSLLMLLFAMPIKSATVYSIATILFSQLAKILTVGFTTGFLRYDLTMLWYIIPAAIIGGLLGDKVSRLLSPKKVTFVFQGVILLVLLVNIYNGIQIIR
ncbi:sulfite exporter TauE/SafE family protein [Tetragenococcus halophilus]|uniref:Probable membrane transporter protein n=1 Tax=Tetragenococcus halophilus TaxID=51669 RepID=A0AB37D6J2_TETHA|nr:sulfite exporter TauE/SafE family protein [Tetragenococcus halophilus]QGP77207.1 TSUP family transporter [Tetragenococcus halophilus]